MFGLLAHAKRKLTNEYVHARWHGNCWLQSKLIFPPFKFVVKPISSAFDYLTVSLACMHEFTRRICSRKRAEYLPRAWNTNVKRVICLFEVWDISVLAISNIIIETLLKHSWMSWILKHSYQWRVSSLTSVSDALIPRSTRTWDCKPINIVVYVYNTLRKRFLNCFTTALKVTVLI